MSQRKSKIVSVEQAVAQIADGSTIAVGGLSYYGAPMDLVRALVRHKARDLTLITAAVTGIQADMLIAGGCVKKIISPYVALEELGLAPAFRKAVEKGSLELVEIGEAFLAFGLKAAAAGAPFYALPLSLAASDCARLNPLYRRSRDPFTGKDVVCVPALPADFTLLHARRSDADGNLQHEGTSFMDPLLARASRHVIATCDELIDNKATRANSFFTSIPGILVDMVIPAHGAAFPTGSFGAYEPDRAEIKRYAKATRNDADLANYLTETARPAPLALAERQPVTRSATDAARPPSPAELIACQIAGCVSDGMFTGAGTGCWEVLAGLRLAQLTHAPTLSFTMGGSGALNPRLPALPPSLNGDEGLRDCDARIGLEELFDLEMGGAFDIMFVSGMQMDRYGNVNLACVGPHQKPLLRGPGTVGLEFSACVPKWVAFFRSHTKQTFVEKVDFVSGMGFGAGPGSRAELGIAEDQGPALVITNLAVMDFCQATRRMRLKSIHPGVTVEQVQQNTGFELIVPGEVPATPQPTESQLRLLREEIDPAGLLTTLIQ